MEDPDSQPYRTVLLGVSDGVRRLNAMRSSTIMRPWLQVFSLRNKYGREQIRLQVKAVKDAGASQWLFWNPGCTYKAEYFEHDAAQAEKVTSSPSPTQ